MSVKNYLDKTGALYELVKLKNYITSTFVTKDGDKVLSTNDYTTAEKTKLSNIEAEANKTIVDGTITEHGQNPVTGEAIYDALEGKQDVLTAGTNIDITNNTISVTGAVDIDDSTTGLDTTWSSSKINTELGSKQDTLTAGTRVTITNQNVVNVSSEIDDSSTTAANTWSADKISSAISAIESVNFEIVQTLPSSDISTHTIYLILKSSSETGNIYDEYIYVNNNWELIGTTAIDLSGYVLESDLVAITNAEIDAMFEIFE